MNEAVGLPFSVDSHTTTSGTRLCERYAVLGFSAPVGEKGINDNQIWYSHPGLSARYEKKLGN